MNALMVFHIPQMSGPAKSMLERFAGTFEPGCRHVVVPARGATAELYAPVADVHVRSYGRLSVPSSPRAAARDLRQFRRDVRTFRALIRDTRAAVVITATTATPAAAVAARLERRTLVVYCGELFAKGYRRSAGRTVAGTFLIAGYARSADAIVGCSDAVVAQFPATRRARLARIYPAVRAGAATPAPAPAGPPAIAAAGLITPARGQDVLVEAVRRLPPSLGQVRLTIAGEPTAAPADRRFHRELAERIGRYGLGARVALPGHVEDVDALYASASVVVNPARFEEPFGRIAFEAAAAGRPVISTDVGAVRELLEDGVNALLVPPDDPEALAAAIEAVLTDPELGGRLVAGAQAALERLDPAAGVAQFRRLMGQLGHDPERPASAVLADVR